MLKKGLILRFLIAIIMGALNNQSTAHATEMQSTQTPILVGDVNSFSLDPKSVTAYENGVRLALEEINANGGVLSRPLNYTIRDDKGNAAEAMRLTAELVSRDHVDLLAGAWYNSTAAAISNYATHNKIPFLATFSPGDAIVGDHKTPFTFSLWPTTRNDTLALVSQAAQSGIKTWAIIVPTFDDGILAQDVFKQELLKKVPDAKIVYEHRYEAEKINAGTLFPVLMKADPEGIFFAGFPTDVVQFVREGNARKWLQARKVFSPWNGYSDVRETIGADLPDGWICTGYPVEDFLNANEKDQPQSAFVKKYYAKYHALPTYGSLHGYLGYQLIAAALQHAGTTDPEVLANAFVNVGIFGGPQGSVRIDSMTHQSNMGSYVGEIRHVNNQARLVNWSVFPDTQAD